MPSKYLEPVVKLTKEQWKAVMRRLLDKEGRLTESLANKIMKTEPPVEQTLGRLEQRIPTGGVGPQLSPGRFLGETTPRVENLPIEEARARYFAAPEQYSSPSIMGEPSAKVLQQFPPGPESGAFARDIAYTRQKFAPIIPPGTRSAASLLKGEAEAGAEESALSRLGLSAEDVRPELPIKKFLSSKGISVAEETPAIAEVLQTAMLADSIWKGFGGGRSAEAKLWDAYRQSSNLKAKFSNARDYFLSSFNRWRQDPGQFSKKYPREGKLLKKIWDTFQEGLGEVE